MNTETLLVAAVMVVLALAAGFDAALRRIPNTLTVTATIAGFLVQAWGYGWSGFGHATAGFIAALFLFFPLFILRWMGAGDVKLMAAVGTYIGWPDTLLAVAMSAISGGLMAVFILIIYGGIPASFRRYASMGKVLFITGQINYIPPETAEAAATVRFPYAIAIATGSIAALWWNGRLNGLIEILGELRHG